MLLPKAQSEVSSKGLETHFQYEFSIFWAVGAAEKKKSKLAISKYVTFEGSFLIIIKIL